MPRGMGNDDDLQRHNANRNGQEGRNQDRTGSNYEIGQKQYANSGQYGSSAPYENPAPYVQVSGQGSTNGAWSARTR